MGGVIGAVVVGRSEADAAAKSASQTYDTLDLTASTSPQVMYGMSTLLHLSSSTNRSTA